MSMEFVERRFSVEFNMIVNNSKLFKEFNTYRESAKNIHKSVNQKYSKVFDYVYHLDCAVDHLIDSIIHEKGCDPLDFKEFYNIITKGLPDDGIRKRLNIKDGEDCPTFNALICAMYHHDVIEDARMTYNDVVDLFKSFDFVDGDKNKNKKQAVLAADLVYALTELKGKTRAERHAEPYWILIRETKGASLLKCCDIMANFEFSRDNNSTMYPKYKKETKTLFEKVNVNELSEYDINKLKSL